MINAFVLLAGVFVGMWLASRFGGLGGGTTSSETCAVWCADGTKKSKTCRSGETGDCLEGLRDECPSVPNV